MKRCKRMNQKEKGITLIALVITIIVLLILAGVSISTLMGNNGILTNASKAKIEDAHASVREAISLAYSEYIMELNTKDLGNTVKVASTKNVRIKGVENNYMTQVARQTFMSYLEHKGYIEEDGVVNVENLVGASLSIGKGNATDRKDVYILQATEDAYILKYYDSKGNSEDLWQNVKESLVPTKTLEIKDSYSNETVLSIEYEEGMTWGKWIESKYNKYAVKVDSVVYCEVEGRTYNIINSEEEFTTSDMVIDANVGYFLSPRPL